MDPALGVEQLTRTFADISWAKPNPHMGCTRPNTTLNLAPNLYDVEFFIRKLFAALKSRKPSAQGPDEITYSFLQHAHPTVLNILLDLFKNI